MRMSEFTVNTELEAMELLFHPHFNQFAHIRWRGFQDGVPPNVRLWDVPPRDGTEPTCNAAMFQENLDFFTEHIGANKEQIEATKESFDSPSGISLIHGGPSSGKTTLSVLQALTAVSLGHKVAICAPGYDHFTIRDRFHEHMTQMPNGMEPKIYMAETPYSTEVNLMICYLALASRESSENKPITLVHEVLNIIRENIRTLKTPEMQALYKSHGEDHPTLKPLIESQTLLDLILKLQDNQDPNEEDERNFIRLYNKIYFRVISEADIIISLCHSFGLQDLKCNFRPTVAIVDNCNLTTDEECLIPLVLYDVQIRILIGDKNVVRPHNIYDRHPPRETTLLERWGAKGVPIHELPHHYPQQARPDAQSPPAGGGGKIARNKACPCGSRRKYKKCCGIDE